MQGIYIDLKTAKKLAQLERIKKKMQKEKDYKYGKIINQSLCKISWSI